MIYILCGFFLIILLSLLFGLYNVRISLEVFRKGISTSIRISSWKNVYGIEWTRREGESYIRGLLMNQSVYRRIKKSKPREEKDVRNKVEKRRRKDIEKHFGCIVRRLFFRVPGLLRGILKCFHVKKMNIQGDFGMGNPALTGIVFGFIQTSRSFQNKNLTVLMNPDFSRMFFEWEMNLVLQCILCFLIWRIIRSGFEIGWTYLKCRTLRKGKN